MPDEETVIIHGRNCPYWDESHLSTPEAIRSHELTWVEEDNWRFGVCPDCLVTVFVSADFGEIDFGV